jgi:hypothetical protein
MLAGHVLDLLRKLQNPNFKFFQRNAKQLLAVNFFEKKVVEIYEVREHDCQLLQKIAFRKRVLKLFQDGQHIYFIDKFGDTYRSEFDTLAEVADIGNGVNEDKPIESDKRLQLVTNFFAQTIELYHSDSDSHIILTDDYYKIKVVDKENLQRIIKVASVRPFFVRRILKIDSGFLFFFDDFKVLAVSDDALLNLEKDFKDSDLIDLCAKSFETFFDAVELVENQAILAVSHNKDKRTLTLLFLDFHREQKAFFVAKESVLENIESEFFVIEKDRIHLAGESVLFKDLK